MMIPPGILELMSLARVKRARLVPAMHICESGEYI